MSMLTTHSNAHICYQRSCTLSLQRKSAFQYIRVWQASKNVVGVYFNSGVIVPTLRIRLFLCGGFLGSHEPCSPREPHLRSSGSCHLGSPVPPFGVQSILPTCGTCCSFKTLLFNILTFLSSFLTSIMRPYFFFLFPFWGSFMVRLPAKRFWAQTSMSAVYL